MNTQKEPRFTPEDLLKAGNNLSKRKPAAGHGTQIDETRNRSREVENEWIKNIYDFQKQSRNARKIKLYDYIGRPTFKPWNSLTTDEIHQELQRMELLMESKGVQLDCLSPHKEVTIYRFITEELFQHEMNDLRISGTTCHFTYEAFYPNHDYDLREQSVRFVKSIFTRPWDEAFDGINLARTVSFSGDDHDRRSISSIMRAFQEVHAAFTIEKLAIKAVTIDATRARVNAALSVSGKMKHGGVPIRYEGTCALRFIRSDECWYIEKFHVPGLSAKK
jgi:hypothetical protein